jgi:hypothetical protein
MEKASPRTQQKSRKRDKILLEHNIINTQIIVAAVYVRTIIFNPSIASSKIADPTTKRMSCSSLREDIPDLFLGPPPLWEGQKLEICHLGEGPE